MLKLNTHVQNVQATNEPQDTQGKIEKLFKTLEDVRKQLRELHKRLAGASPAERMEIRQQITALEELRDTVQQQIVNLSQMEEKRKHNRHPD